jgi:hypothetical protein
MQHGPAQGGQPARLPAAAAGAQRAGQPPAGRTTRHLHASPRMVAQRGRIAAAFGPAAAVAQRKVGFEIDVESHAFAKIGGKGTIKQDKGHDWDFKQDLLKLTAYGITIQFDSGTVEVILSPVDEPGGEAALAKKFEGIGLIFDILDRVEAGIDFIHDDDEESPGLEIVHPADQSFRREDDSDETSGDGESLSTLEIRRTAKPGAPVFGDLQGTAGVKFEAIGTLADVLTGTPALESGSESYAPHSWDPKEAYGNKAQKNYVAEASTRVLQWVARNTKLPYERAEGLMGFLTIVVSYLITSARSEQIQLQDAKGLAPLMSRVALHEVFAPLGKRYADVKLTAEDILAMAGVADGPLYQLGQLPPNYEKFCRDTLTTMRSAWLEGILSGSGDVLKDFGDSMSEVTDGEATGQREGRTTGDFKMKNAVDIGYNRQGMILEFRRLPRHLNFRNMRELAFNLYRLVEAANKL